METNAIFLNKRNKNLNIRRYFSQFYNWKSQMKITNEIVKSHINVIIINIV